MTTEPGVNVTTPSTSSYADAVDSMAARVETDLLPRRPASARPGTTTTRGGGPLHRARRRTAGEVTATALYRCTSITAPR
jgi:hypothetical protein